MGEKMFDYYRISFIGHREIYGCNWENRLEKIITEAIRSHDVVELYIGRNGDFDIMAASVIKRIQRNFDKHKSSLNLVLPYRVKDIEYYEKYYDDIILPLDTNTHPKAAITKRNQWMIDNSDLLVAYVEPNRKGGALAAFQYAQKQGVEIINLAIKSEEE